MATVELEEERVREELERALSSRGFARNARLSRFLRFLVERHLEGRDQELKESVIGSEVFGRKRDYNPREDPIVRTEARRLRARLSEYYEGPGAADELVIELPKGGYVPLVRQIAGLSEAAPASRSRLGEWQWVVLVLAALGLVLTGVAWKWSAVHKPAKSEAYELYVRARTLEMQPQLSGIENSLDLFQRAVEKDASFAPGYAGIAAGCAARSSFDGFNDADRARMLADGWSAARKAMELDPQSPDAHEALAMMQARVAQWGAAESGFRRAIELAPDDPLWRDHFSMFLLMPLGRLEEAIRQLRAALEREPLSASIHSQLAQALSASGQSDQALSHCQKGASNDQLQSTCWAQALQRQGKYDEAVRILEPIWSGHLMQPGAQALGIAYAKAGRIDDARRVAALLPRPASKAKVFAAMKDRDETLRALDTILPMGPTRLGREFLINPDFAFLQGDPHLHELKKKAGIPE